MESQLTSGNNESDLRERRRVFVSSVILCIALAAIMAWVRLGIYRNMVLPIGYGVPLVIAGWTRARKLLWFLTFFFAGLIVIEFLMVLPGHDPAHAHRYFLEFVAVLMDLLLVGFVVDRLMVNREEVEARTIELGRLNEELEHRRVDAEEASVRKSKFLAAVSHDIRTPANAISLLAELVQRTAKDPASASEIPELAMELQKSSLDLVHLVSDVLDLTRLDAGRIELKEVEFDLGEWLGEECNRLAPLAAAKKIGFDCGGVQPAIRVRCDRVKLSRITTNLIGNAIKFTEEGKVCVQATRGTGGVVHLAVKDTGIGIAPEHLAQVFDEFFQLRNAERDQSKGSGLGLSISKRLAEAMGAEMVIESAVGKGSTFTLVLPASIVIG